jgi:hypothetical protein
LQGRRQLDDVMGTIDYHLTRLFGEP